MTNQLELFIFSIMDKKAEAYLSPFFSANEHTALRSFSAACNDLEHDFNRHAEDYSLWMVGKFDQAEGAIYTMEKRCIAQAFDTVKWNTQETTPGLVKVSEVLKDAI